MNSKGFSLIELMVVIAIVGLLAGGAVSAYKQHFIKSQISSIIPIMESYKRNTVEHFSLNGSMPTTQSDIMPMAAPSGTIISSVTAR